MSRKHYTHSQMDILDATKKDTQLHVRISKNEKQLLRDKAMSEGITISKYVLKQAMKTDWNFVVTLLQNSNRKQYAIYKEWPEY